jgi:antitoxin ParD1/3/4
MSPLDRLQQHPEKDALKLEALREQLRAGVEAFERGDFVEIDEVGLENYFERLTASANSRFDPSP